jgi:hypothetical protein
MGSVKHPARLIHSLLDEENPVSRYLMGTTAPPTSREFGADISLQLRDYEKQDQPTPDLLKALVMELNQIIAGPSLYEGNRFRTVQLSAATQELMRQNPNGAELFRLNRTLLQSAYPHEITEGSAALGVADFIRPAALAHKLKDEQEPLSNYLYRKFVIGTRQLLDEYDNSTPPDRKLVRDLVGELNRLIAGVSLYERDRFEQVELSAGTRELAAQDPQGPDLFCLNRVLLEAAYPGGLATHRLEIHQKPETLHFGLDKRDAHHPGGFYKKLRDREGRESEENAIDPIPWRSRQESTRVINIASMCEKSNATNSANFALQMIEGVEKVVFTNG